MKTIQKAKAHFLKTFSKRKRPIYLYLPRHIQEVERWANIILPDYPQADPEVVLLSVWLHDIGQAVGDDEIDHAIRSEKETVKFLTEIKLNKDKINKVAHSVRAHRNKDVKPETLEARLLIGADSASHFTDINYIIHCSDGEKKYALEKIDRDYRDINLIPELKPKIKQLYFAWKKLLLAYPD